ncbi:hypothetical protein LDENG_00154720 [Lucifuga dentata]|nr:hypothetical protein LDENG_00154720 [Lucifuga dentata]
MWRLRVAPLVALLALIISQKGAAGGALSALRRAADFLPEDPNACLSLRENEEQRNLLCNDRRSKFNLNAFGLRFGKRFNSYIYRSSTKRARTDNLTPLSVFPRELEVPT